MTETSANVVIVWVADALAALLKLLRRLGHDVVGASSVAEGLDAARQGRYDLLISDVGLPDGTGHDLMRQVRAMYGLRGIALSGYGMDDDMRKSRDAGFVEHIVKPINLGQLQAIIQRVTGGV